MMKAGVLYHKDYCSTLFLSVHCTSVSADTLPSGIGHMTREEVVE